MKRATVLFLLLAAVFSFGRTVSDEDIAHALKVALDQRDHPRDPDSVQVSSVLITDKGICIEYRSESESGAMHSGFAVYKTDQKLVFLDNSWIWGKTCLTGKYAQHREGKNVTQAVTAALKRQSSAAAVASVETAPAAQPVVPVAAPVAVRVPSAPAPVAVIAPAPVAAPPVTQPVATAAPVAAPMPTAPPPVAVAAPARVAARPVAQPVATAAPVAVPIPASSPSVVVVVVAPTPASAPPMTRAAVAPAAPVAAAPVAAPAPAPPQPAPSPVVRVAAPVPAVPAETGTIHGATIIDNNGALGKPTPDIAAPAAEESLADAARRVRKTKQQKAGYRTPKPAL